MDYVGEGGLNDIRSRIFKRTGQVSLNSSGEAVIDFGSPIILARQPYVNLTAEIGASEAPVIVNIIDGTFTTNGDGNYTGVTIKGARMRGLPNPLTLLSALVGFETWTGSAASGTKVDWMAF